MPAEKHYVYAAIRTSKGIERFKVSGALSWGAAQDRWSLLDDMRFYGKHIEVLAHAVTSFAVRSESDPSWPRRAYARHVLYQNESGVLINL